MDRHKVRRHPPISLAGAAAALVLGAGACGIVLGTLPPVVDGGAGGGSEATSSTSGTGTASSTSTSTSGSGGGCSGGEVECAPGHPCVDLSTDPQFCGGCNTRCKGGQSCVTGSCQDNPCALGLTLCSGKCVNTQSDGNNCNTCGNACPVALSSDKDCQSGGCTTACKAGVTACSLGALGPDSCADLQSDPANCGFCGTLCPADEVCIGASCVAYVPASAAWECTDGLSSLTMSCSVAGQDVCIGVMCP